MMEFKPNGLRNLTVFYDSWMEGGGTWFGQEYVDIIRSRYPEYLFEKCYEWCSGPGFIGFSLLDHGICQKLCVSDIYESAITKAVKATTDYPANNCKELITAYATGTLSAIPENEMFDLVVSNPPHFLECPGDENMQRIKVDADWQAHQDFFKHIKQHLLPEGVILLQENQAGSLNGAEDFRPFIESNGLVITDCFKSPQYYTPDGHTQIYYIEIKHSAEKV